MSVDTSRATVEALASDLDRQNEYEPLGHDGWTAAATLRALLAERDALIHDIERAKDSESALLAELEQARGIVRQGSRVNSDWFQRRDHMAPSRHSKNPLSCTFDPSTS